MDADPYAAFASPAPAPAAAPAAVDPYSAFSSPLQVPSAPQAAAPSVGADVAKSVGSGLVKGAADVVTAPGDLADWIGNSAEWALQHGLAAAGLAPQGVQPDSMDQIVANNRALSQGSTILPRSEDTNAMIKDAGISYAPQTTAGKYAQTAAEFVPGAALTGGESLAANAVRYGVLPGLASEAAGQATEGTPIEGAARMAAAVLAPSAARVVTPLPITAERQALVQTLQDQGVPLTAGQVSGSKALRYAESHLGEVPFSGGRVQQMDEAQKAAYTRSILRSIGVDAEHATPDVLAGARQAIGDSFNQLSARNTATFDQPFAQALGQVLNEYDGLTLPTQRAPIVDRTIQGLTQIGGSMPGTQYQAVRSNLDKAARQVVQSNPPLSQALFGIRNALDDVMTRSISPQDADAWQLARNQWRNWKAVERAATSAGENAAQGNISPAAIRSAVVGQNRGAYAVGRGDLADIARAGVGVMSPLPNSGTPARMAIHSALSSLGAVAGTHAGGMEGAAVGAMAPLVAPGILGRILMSRPTQAYLSNQALAGLPDTGVLGQILLMNTARDALPAPAPN